MENVDYYYCASDVSLISLEAQVVDKVLPSSVLSSLSSNAESWIKPRDDKNLLKIIIFHNVKLKTWSKADYMTLKHNSSNDVQIVFKIRIIM